MTTKQLAAKFNTSVRAVIQANYAFGHFKGYQVVGREPGPINRSQNLWSDA